MRILYVASRFDYGRPERGLSFEHWNFFHTLESLGHDIIYFDYMYLLGVHGREKMNRRLSEVARAEQPDLMFTVLFQEQLEKQTVRDISDSGQTVTLNWFCDDQWRFEEFAQHWAPCFNWVVTTAKSAVSK